MQTHYPNLTRESKLPSLLFQLCFEKNLAQWVSDRRFLLRIMSVYFCTPKKNVIGRRLCDFSSHLNTNGFYCGSYWFIWLHYFSYADKHKHMSVPGRGLPTLWLLVVWYAGGSRSLFLLPPLYFPETFVARFVRLKTTWWWLSFSLFPPSQRHHRFTGPHGNGERYPWATVHPESQRNPDHCCLLNTVRVKYLLDLFRPSGPFHVLLLYICFE